MAAQATTYVKLQDAFRVLSHFPEGICECHEDYNSPFWDRSRAFHVPKSFRAVGYN